MADLDLIAHLDQMERRLRDDMAEIRTGQTDVVKATAGLEPRVRHLEGRARVMEGIFGTAFLTLCGTFWAHLTKGGR